MIFFSKKAPLLAPSLVWKYLLVHLECHTHPKGCLHGAIYLFRIMDCSGIFSVIVAITSHEGAASELILKKYRAFTIFKKYCFFLKKNKKTHAFCRHYKITRHYANLTNDTVSVGDTAISLHTPVPWTILHEKFQFWGVGGILGKLRPEIPKSSMRSSDSESGWGEWYSW